MDATAPGLWLCPTFGRVRTNVPRLLKACRATHMTTPGVLVVDEADYAAHHDDYDALDFPFNWTMHIVPGGSSGEAFEQAKAFLFADHMWLGFLSDDLIPETPEWDVRVIQRLNGMNFVSTNDGARAPKRINGAQAWSGDFVRALGYIYPPGLKHLFVDDMHEDIGQTTGLWFCDMGVMVRHAHHSYGGPKDPTSTHADSFFIHDQKIFLDWKMHERVPAIERIMLMMQDKGVALSKPDLRGMKIMLAVPNYDGTLDREFVTSYVATRDAVKQFGGELHLVEAPFLADIALARSKLFGHFLRSDDTHCFFIDSDQGWQAKDFIRLLMAKKDFVAAAGVRKTYPPTFAFNNVDDHGNILPISGASNEGLMEVTHVGFAFVCVTKEWAVRMSQVHADMAYVGPDGLTDYAIFDPIIINKRRLSEDYSACERWRRMGGKVLVAPEISLKHVGIAVYEGAWMTQLIEHAEREARDRAEAA